MGEAYGAFDYYFPKPGAVVTFEYEAGVTEGGEGPAEDVDVAEARVYKHGRSDDDNLLTTEELVKNGPGTLELDISGYTAKEHSPLLVRFYFKKDHTKGIRAGTSQEASFDCYVSLASPAVGAIEVSAAEAKTGEEVQVKVSQWAALVYDSPGRPDLDDDPERVDESRFPDGTADEVKWTRKGKDESEAVEHDSGSESSYSHEAEEAEETEEPEETDDDDDDTPPEPRLFPFVFSAHVGDQADECSLLPEAEVCFVEEPEPQECEFKGLLGAYILDGDDADEPTTEHTQYVNLDRHRKWVGSDPKVDNLDRLSRKPRLKLKHTHPGTRTIQIKVRTKEGATNQRSGTPSPSSFSSHRLTFNGDGIAILEDAITLPKVNGNDYEVVAKDSKGTEVVSNPIKTKSRLFYVALPMTGCSNATNRASFRSAFTDSSVEFKEVGTASVDRVENIGNNDDKDAYAELARAAYLRSGKVAYEPHLIAVGYTDHLAVQDEGVELVKASVQVGPGKPKVTIPVVNAAGTSRPLWNKIVTGESWFVSAKFEPDDQSWYEFDTTVPQSAITAKGSGDSLKTLEIDVTGLSDEARTGTLTVECNVVNRMRGGVSFGGGNLVVICTRAWWHNKTNASQNQVTEHEVGHKVGMVPSSHPKHYTGRGHRGGHCHAGLALLPSFSNSTGSCTMFGSTSTSAGFCVDCIKALRDLDMGKTLSRF